MSGTWGDLASSWTAEQPTPGRVIGAGIPGNSTWAEGDWNCDGDFTSSDMITAFLTGSYEVNARPGDAVFAAAASHSESLSDIRFWLDTDKPTKKRSLRISTDGV